MELRVLRYFLTVAGEGNITKAAEILHITQPTLSRQLMQLEEELGTQLFERGKRHVVLTDNGILFQQRAREIIALADKAGSEFHKQKGAIGGVIYLGSVEGTCATILPHILREFSHKYPMVQYDLYTGYGDDIKEKMDRGLIDVALLIEPVETSKYDFIRLPKQEQWGILMPLSDPLSQKQYVMLDEVKYMPLIIPKRPIVQNEMASWFGDDYEKLKIFATYNLLSNAALLVDAGLGYAVCIQEMTSYRQVSNTCFVPLKPQRTSSTVLVWRKKQVFSTATSIFIQNIKLAVNDEIFSRDAFRA